MLSAIIVDDEQNSRNSLRQKLLNHCSDVQIVAECENGEEGIAAIERLQPDMVFLDVEMPRMNGFNMLQQLTYKNFGLIFITAYDHYAISAIKFSALDYLVKPVEVEELKIAVEKAAIAKAQTTTPSQLQALLTNLLNKETKPKRLALPSMEGLQFVDTDDIIYLEALSNYTHFHLTGNKKIIVAKTLKDFEEMLPSGGFIRIHHSYIINIYCVEKYIKGDGGQVIMKNGVTLDVSRRKKEEFLKAISV